MKTIILVVTGILFSQGMAQAQPVGPGPMKGPGAGGPCGRGLMRAQPDLLKAQLGLSDAQLGQLQAVRTNMVNKEAQLRGQMQQHQLQMQSLMAADLPDLNKVLEVERKIRGLHGQLTEERIKAHLKFMQLLSQQQRTALRAACPGGGGRGLAWRGGGHGQGRGGKGGFGFGFGGGGGRHGRGFGGGTW
jgi:Spy/CpxP family protein refolding chaperone